jgi:hypothetical protein
MKPADSTSEQWTVVGAAVPATDAAVRALDGGRTLSLGAADPSFDPAAFTTWSATVFGRAMKAWQTGHPEPLQPVMQDQVWDHYAQWLLFVRAIPLARSIMAAAQGVPTFVGAVADAGYHSAMVEFRVAAHVPTGSVVQLRPEEGQWRERWLFQRPATCRTNPSGAVAVCPVCGAPAEPEETGRCRYCHADVTTRTAGWQVTRTATTMSAATRLAQRLAGWQNRATPAAPRAAPVQPPRAAPRQPPRAAAPPNYPGQ